MNYRVILKIDGRWQDVARGFERLDGATGWAQEVLDVGPGMGITGYQILDETDRVVCSVER